MSAPACGLYRTTQALPEVPAGRLVYFHNHGNPGAGIYLPRAWASNRAQFHENGVTVTDAFAGTLQPLPAEGLYRVTRAFFCCEKQCHRFEPEALVQLGFNGNGDAILFNPEWVQGALVLPERGTGVGPETLAHLSPLRVAERTPAPVAGLLH